ncbi:hypothetical protein BCR43DRAFT_490364 [Syncephalastrum racemosum]|uniref:Membrane anchor Opy2 N-terminal domain-containing protein n=1 Tax=Syncephalastrum racemosum TaxID=13706 RepID=A0A1X2HFV0_SYNRA|nr:hypothetical protein BCR43DRAFT_490364 [Syncephalastrum racemosum]
MSGFNDERFSRRELDSKSCRPSNCKAHCEPACSSHQKCVLMVMTACGQCPASQCVDLSALTMPSTDATTINQNVNAGSGNRVGLIAGLATGLSVAALIGFSVAGLVYYRRRRRQRPDAMDADPKRSSRFTLPVVQQQLPPAPPPAAALWPLLPERKQQHSSPPSTNITPPVFVDSLQIPSLAVSPSSPSPSSTTTPRSMSNTTIRRSLNLAPQRPSLYSSTTNTIAGPTPLNRSSSVRVTKYDHPSGQLDTLADDDLNQPVQLRRAVSVNRRQKSDLSRNASVRSMPSSQSRMDESDSVSGISEGSSVPILYAKPTLVRISTVSRKDASGVTRKASVRRVINDQPSPPAPSHPPPPSSSTRHSVAESSHSSIGDGEITVIWDPSHH